jgi:prepilin-type N-terminal cleavage/methylation domain-containing protein/prepilin-type processing-associated H-X9-DG protein
LSYVRRAADARPAFTLIELLVVVAIVALLIGLLLPALGMARGAGRSIACLSRVRDLAAATAAYSQSNGEAIPRSQHSAGAHRQGAWEQLHFAYFDGAEYNYGSGEPWWDDESWWRVCREHYQCPFDRRENPSVRDGLPFPVPALSYGQNVYFELRADEIDPHRGRRTEPYRRLPSIPAPAATVLFGELKDSSLTDHLMPHMWTLNGATPELDSTRHGASSGIAYLDGHAGDRALADNYDPDAGVDRWNPATAR